MGEERGWTVEVRLANANDPARVDALFARRTGKSRRATFAAGPAWRWREQARYATDPLRAQRIAALTHALRAHLLERLPEYMVPAAFFTLDALPLTPNGKVDRRALPAPERDARQQAYEAPAGEIEKAMAEIWSELLRITRVGRQDNFFELGGHSLLAVRLLERLRQGRMHAEIHALLASPTLAGMAAAVVVPPVEIVVPPNLIRDRQRVEPAGGSDTVELYL